MVGMMAALCFSLLPGPAVAAPTVLKPYAHDQSKRFAKKRCAHQKGCESAEVTKCVDYKGAVECVVLAEYTAGPMVSPGCRRTRCFVTRFVLSWGLGRSR